MTMKSHKSKRKEVIPRLGRPPIVRRPGENILSNNLFQRQWKWIQKEAVLSNQDGAQYLRWLIDLHIASIEASRSDPQELEETLFKDNSNHNKE